MSRRRGCVYFNTSLLIRAVNEGETGHREAVRFIEELKELGYVLVYSSIHFLEGFRERDRKMIENLFRKYGFAYCNVPVRALYEEATQYLVDQGYSLKHRLDVMHMLAAVHCGCRYIAAVDRFIRSHAPEFGLVYINYYTGVV